MDSGTAMTLLKLLSSDKFKGVAKGAAAGDKSALSMLFNAAGLSNPTDDDLNDLQSLAGLFGTVIDDTGGKGNYQSDWTDPNTIDQLQRERKAMRGLITGTPQEMAIKAGVQAVGQLARAGGDIAANNGNRLAAALMAANRTNSARQNDIYGPSRKEKATEAWGQDKIRRGNNWQIALNKVGDFVDKVLGTYQVADATAGNAALTRELAREGMSSGAFDQLGRGVTASKNMIKQETDMALNDDKKKETAEAINDKKDQAVSEINDANKKASDKTRKYEQEQYNKDKSELDPNAGKNIAKGESKYGTFNDRDYSTTLRLAREADRYNNRPTEHVIGIGTRKTGGIKDYGLGYDKPKISTMETRAMDQAQQLDTQQKSAAIALQDAVNRKDLEAFKMAYMQLHGITLSERDAIVAMTNMIRGAESQQILAQGMDYFKRAFGTETGVALYNLSQSDNPMLANMIGQIITGGVVPPEKGEVFLQQAVDELAKEYQKQGKDKNTAYILANARVTSDLWQYNNMQQAILTHNNRFGYWKGAKTAKQENLWQEIICYRQMYVLLQVMLQKMQ